MSIRNSDRNVSKFFLSPFRAEELMQYARLLHDSYGIDISVNPQSCKIIVDGYTMPDNAPLHSEATLQYSHERIITVRKVGKSALCIRIIRPDTHGYSSIPTAWDRFAQSCWYRTGKSIGSDKTLEPSNQKDYESHRDYRERIQRKTAQGRYKQEIVRLPK